jgi:hypothetical protein
MSNLWKDFRGKRLAATAAEEVEVSPWRAPLRIILVWLKRGVTWKWKALFATA